MNFHYVLIRHVLICVGEQWFHLRRFMSRASPYSEANGTLRQTFPKMAGELARIAWKHAQDLDAALAHDADEAPRASSAPAGTSAQPRATSIATSSGASSDVEA